MAFISYEKIGPAGVISINKSSTLNSFDAAMIDAIDAFINEGVHNPNITHFVLKSDLEGIFSAGGDLKKLYVAYMENDLSLILSFFKKSYLLNLKINRLSKPFISIVNGLCLGGGMGLAINGFGCIYGDQAIMAMPEVYIGFFPDVGARFFLQRCFGKIGLFLGMTGYQMNATDIYNAGFAANYVPNEHLKNLLDALTSIDVSADTKAGLMAIFDLFSQTPVNESSLKTYRTHIDDIFGGENLEEILLTAKMSKVGWMRQLSATMETASPLSLAVTYKLFQNPPKSLEKALEMDLNLAHAFLSASETIEGVRARIIDKDKSPNWTYKKVFDVDNSVVTKLMSTNGLRLLK